MKTVKPSATMVPLLTREDGIAAMKHIEMCVRVCYKSEGCVTEDSWREFVPKIVNTKKHESVVEHSSITVHVICDRGVSHELVRHRLVAYSQESTRYCNYSKDKFDNQITFIEPLFFPPATPEYIEWMEACSQAELSYFNLLKLGKTPQEARSVLPNSLKTELFMTTNLREWKHIFRLRCASTAHPQMRQIMIPLLDQFKQVFEPLFNDIIVA